IETILSQSRTKLFEQYLLTKLVALKSTNESLANCLPNFSNDLKKLQPLNDSFTANFNISTSSIRHLLFANNPCYILLAKTFNSTLSTFNTTTERHNEKSAKEKERITANIASKKAAMQSKIFKNRNPSTPDEKIDQLVQAINDLTTKPSNQHRSRSNSNQNRNRSTSPNPNRRRRSSSPTKRRLPNHPNRYRSPSRSSNRSSSRPISRPSSRPSSRSPNRPLKSALKNSRQSTTGNRNRSRSSSPTSRNTRFNARVSFANSKTNFHPRGRQI
ncbi:hypothetical protein BDR26DRAFT_972329, partial [Obelidium mucronatum]